MTFLKGRDSVVATFLAVLIVLGVTSSMLEKKAAVQASGLQAPRFEVDPLWPRPLPNHWLLGMTIGVSVDSAGSRLDRSSAGYPRSQGSLHAGQSSCL
jgi:hypothetical protein